MDPLNIAFLLCNIVVLYVLRSWGVVAKQALTAVRSELNSVGEILQEVVKERDALLKEVETLNRSLGDLDE